MAGLQLEPEGGRCPQSSLLTMLDQKWGRHSKKRLRRMPGLVPKS